MKKEFNINVHKSLKARKLWGIKMKFSFVGFLVQLCICSVMLYYGFNHKWDPETEMQPSMHPQTWWQWTLLIVGAILAVAALIGYVVFVWNESKHFYASQAKYWATEEYAKQKQEALKVDLVTLKKGQLKWYKRMGYINGDLMRQTFEQQRQLKTKNKKK